MNVKEEHERTGLKLNIQKPKIVASGPVTSCQIDGETMETVRDFIFLGSKITADGDCSHEIKRCLLLGRKTMTNLYTILKSRNITWPKKVHIVKATVFSVVWMWQLDHKEGWVPKNRYFWTIVLEKTLESPLDCKEIQSILKEISPECLLEGLMLKLKLQYFGHLMGRADSLEKNLIMGKIEGWRGWQRTRSLDGITNSMDMSLSNLQEMVKDRKAWQAEVHGVTKSQTWLSNWTTIIIYAVACIHCMSTQFQDSVTPASFRAHFFY